MLYVANCSKQAHSFIFRTPESSNTQKREIQPGSQVAIDLDGPAINYVIDQHRRYGLVPVETIDQTKPFIGLCFSLTKPVSVNKIMAVAEHNDQALTNASLESRQLTVASLHQAINNNPEMPVKMSGLEVEIVEVKRGTEDPNVEGFSQTLEVTRDGKPTERGQRKRARAKPQ